MTSLRESGWLKRVLEVQVSDHTYTVKYTGRGLGREAVFVDGLKVAGGASWLWFIPRFEFEIDSKEAVVEVRVNPWLTIRRFSFSLDGEIQYSEP